jgi:hypothetical protein
VRNVGYARYGADILGIGEGVQDQHMRGCSWGSLAVGPPGQGLRLHVLQAQGDWRSIVRPDLHDPFRHRPSLIGARRTQVKNTRVEDGIEPERSAPDQAHIGIRPQAVEVLLLRRGLDGAILGERSQRRPHRCEAGDYRWGNLWNARGCGGSDVWAPGAAVEEVFEMPALGEEQLMSSSALSRQAQLIEKRDDSPAR